MSFAAFQLRTAFKHLVMFVLLILVITGVSQPSVGQQESIAERLQLITPRFLLDQQLNDRGLRATAEACIRPGDEIWLISTRHLECSTNNPNDLNVSQACGGTWHPSSFDQLNESHQVGRHQTVFYAHGNMTDINWSVVRALQLYQNLFRANPQGPPIRFVIWSWPSERQTIPIRDALLKSRRAVVEGVTMRAAADALAGTRPSMIGYSFGAQVVVSALDNISNRWDGQKYKAALVAPGFDRDYIHCAVNPDSILSSCEDIVAFVNSNDRVIRASNSLCRTRFRRFSKCDASVASKLGCSAILREVDLSAESPKKHSIALYGQNATVIRCINEQLNSFVGNQTFSGFIQDPAILELNGNLEFDSNQ